MTFNIHPSVHYYSYKGRPIWPDPPSRPLSELVQFWLTPSPPSSDVLYGWAHMTLECYFPHFFDIIEIIYCYLSLLPYDIDVIHEVILCTSAFEQFLH